MRYLFLLKKEKLFFAVVTTIVLIFLLIITSCNKKEVKKQKSEYGMAIVHLTDSTGMSVNDIKLTVRKVSNPDAGIKLIGLSGPSGNFKIDKLLPGEYSVSAEGQLILPDVIKFTISKPTDTISLNYKIKRFSGNLRLLSYNVLEGLQHLNTEKEKAFIDWVKALNPDIICYQELNSFTPKLLAQLAKNYHHPYSTMFKVDNYPIGISSKYPIKGIQKLAVNGSVHGCILAQVLGINIFALHLSPGSLTKRIDEMKGLSNKAKLFFSNSFTLFVGDFNSYSEFNKENYGMNWTQAMNKMKPTVTQDFTVTNTLLNMNYKDSYAMFHNQFKRSAPTNKYFKHQNKWKGVRYDYVFLSPELAKYCTDADIIHDSITDDLSDHYPMVVDFRF